MGKVRRQLLFGYLCLFLVGLLFFGPGPMPAGADNHGGEYSLQAARVHLEGGRANIPGFAGIAHSDGQIIVFLENEAVKSNVPDSFDGFPVRKIVSGKFKALGYPETETPVMTPPEQVMQAPVLSRPKQANISRSGTFRPLVGGVSFFSSDNLDYYGTLGMVTYDNKLLSCAHVIALDPVSNNLLPQGTAVIQPAGSATSRVGAFQQWVPITFDNPSATNHCDAAIATIDSGITASDGVQLGDPNSNYTVSGTTTVAVGDNVRKSGATTGVTMGTVSATNFSGPVSYGSHTAWFSDQIVINSTTFSAGGDSGSCVDKGGQFVGLVFAGSSTQSIICKASYIINGLGISVNQTPAAPALTSPANGSSYSGPSVTFQWSASAGATQYRLQVNTNSSFTGTDIYNSVVTGTSQTVSGFSNNGNTWYWRVYAGNAGGQWSAASSTYSFINGNTLTIHCKIGTFRPSLNWWALDYNGNGAWDPGIDKVYAYGASGDIPVTGNWNGGGKTEIGTFRPSVNWWALDYNGNGAWDPGIDKVYAFGASGDIPVTGDWNGDGKAKIGTFRPSVNWWALDYNGNGAWDPGIDKVYAFGTAGDIPVTGDWNGNGKTKIGTYRPSSQLWALDYNGNGAYDPGIDKVYTFGAPGDIPVTGDWNGDGRTKIGVFRPSTNMWYLDYNGDGVFTPGVDVVLGPFGTTNDIPVTGLW